MREIIGYGGKSGSGGSGGSETPDSLHSISYAKVLDLVSEGEIQGLADGMKSVYFNETPLQNADGTYNFKGATVDFRPGTQVQDPIDGFPDVSNEIGVGVELRSTSPWTKSISNTQLTSVSIRLGINALTKADTANGSIGGYTVAYKIELSTDGSAYEVVVDSAFSGKTTSQYQRSHRIKLPKANTGWTVRVVRTTPNANSSTTADGTTILTYTELIDARMRYPMSAIVGVQIDAAQFQSIPTRAYDLYGRILSVPSNYDPVARTYSGIWNGTFKPAWTNNPAWIFYDLLINGRYGLGNLIPSSYVDKWGLYQIAQYCDQMVPDGHGGTEPRFTCNLYLQSAAEAYKVLQDLAALFRGITYWAGGTIMASADMPQDPTYIFTAANVIDGKFHNTGSSKKTRYTVAVVSWNDPANFYKPKAEYVQDDEGLIRYGVQQLNLTAFGCTSQGQAQRAGKWALLTSRLETDVVTFSVALDALVVTPGQVVRIANPNKAGRRNGGRIRAAVGRVVTLDKAPVIAAGDSLSVILPTGISETKTVESISSNDVTVSGDWSVLPQAPAIWSVESTNLVAPTYRIISITQKDSFSFEISAIRHEPGKFGYIDNGTKIQAQPVTIQKSIPSTPTNLMFSSTPYWVDDSVSAVDGILSWTGYSPNYLVSYRRGDDIWTDKNVATSSIDIKAMQPGDYSFSVTAVSSTGLKSQAATYTATVTPQLPPLPAVTGLALESAFTTNSAKLKWNGVIGATSYKMSVVANGVTVRTVALGNALRYEYNTADMKADGGPWRNVSFNVQAFGKFGTQSPVASLSANNPQIGALTNIRIDAGIRTGFFKCTPPGDEDFAGIIVWISTDPTCPATDGNKVYDGQDTFVTISKLGDGVTSLDGDTTYYVRAAAYDTFGKDSLTISSAIVFTAVANAPDANSITAAMIKAGVLDITKFASGLQPVGVVNGLPAVAGYTGPLVVTNSVDGKLYRLVGGAWTSAVPTADLSGQISDAQLAAVSAAKIAGQLSDAQLAAISAAKVSGQLSNAQLAAIDAAKVTGQLVTAQIAAAAVTADKLGVALGGGNLVKNSGFESPVVVAGVADGWSIYNNSGSAVPTSAAIVAGRLGGSAQKIYWSTANNGETKGICGPACSTGWLPNKTYVISFYACTTNLNVFTQMMLGWNVTPLSTVTLSNPTLSTDWQRYAFRITWGPTVEGNGLVFLSIANLAASVGEVIFDDIQITEGDTLTGYAPMVGEILPNAVASLQLAAGAVTSAKTAIAAIDPSSGNLTANSVTAVQIAAGAVTAVAIQAGSITGDRLAANTIGANQIAAGSITGDRLQANTVTANQIDSRSLSIRDAAGNIILAAGTPLAAANISPAAGWLNSNVTVDSNGVLQGAGSSVQVANNQLQNNVLHIKRPQGGSGSMGAPNTSGAIKIRLPQGFTNTMLRFTLDVYEYGPNASASYDIGGYNYQSDLTWYNTFVRYLGPPGSARPVYFGHDGNYACIWIGDPSGLWQYPQVQVHDFVAGHSNIAENQWATGWQISWDTGARLNTTASVANPVAGGALSGVDQLTASNAATYIANAAIQDAQIANLNGNKIVANSITAGSLAAGAVTTPALAAGAVTATQVAVGSLTGDHLAANTITATNMQAGSVTTAVLAAGAVTAGTIAAGAITTPAISAGAVTANQLAANSVTANAIAANSITTAAIQAGAVQANQIAAGAITASKLAITSTGTNLWVDPCYSDLAAWQVSNWGQLPEQWTSPAPGDLMAGGYALLAQNGMASARGAFRVPVTPGKLYKVSAWVRANPTHNGTFWLRVDAGNTQSGEYGEVLIGQENISVPSDLYWRKYEGFFTPTAGQTWASPALILNYQATAGWMMANDIRIEEVIPGTLIQDGAITTQKITAAAITGDKVAANAISTVHLSANSITANQLSASSVTASALAAGSVTAQAMSVTSLSAISANLGQVTAGDLYSTTLHGGGGYPHSTYSWPTNGGDGYHLSSTGLLLGNPSTGKYFQILADGNVYAPGMSIVNGALTISQANVINTLQIANEAVTLPRSAASSGNTVSVSIVLDAPSNVFAIGCVTQPNSSNVLMTYQTDGGAVQTAAEETPGDGQIVTIQRLIYLQAGTTTVTYSSNGGMARNANIILIGCRK